MFKKILCIILILFTITACKKNLPVADKLAYSGKLNGNYVSADMLVSMFEEVRECMNADKSIPYPDIEIYSGGKYVICNDDISYSCFKDNKVILPQETYVFAIKDSFIHYLLWKISGNPDYNHVSPYFLKCTDISLMEEDSI
jgi:hypothetical protein